MINTPADFSYLESIFRELERIGNLKAIRTSDTMVSEDIPCAFSAFVAEGEACQSFDDFYRPHYRLQGHCCEQDPRQYLLSIEWLAYSVAARFGEVAGASEILLERFHAHHGKTS